jgi:cytochrome c oxidase subunit 2
MGIKIDANPGEFTETAVTPNKIGVYDIRCAELCGLLHAYMQNKVIVESKEDFDKWMANEPDTGKTTWTEEGADA